jgi:hypothetical protein
MTLGNYRLVRELGRGGMGIVYLAEHEVVGRLAAIKVLNQEFGRDAREVERFFREIKALAKIKHPSVVETYDFGLNPDGLPFLVMEWLEGKSLRDQIDHDGRQPISVVTSLAFQAATGLAAVHRHLLVHRDVSPSNLFLVADEAIDCGWRVKLLDFGIAKATLQGSEVSLTDTGKVVGNPRYMAPELWTGVPANVRSDIYALGCVIYEMVCGELPSQSIEDAVAGRDLVIPPLRAKAPEGPAELESIVMRAMSRIPAQRQTSMEQLALQLRALVTPHRTPLIGWQTEVSRQAVPTVPERVTNRRAGENWRVTGAVALGTAAVAALVSVRIARRPEAPTQLPHATVARAAPTTPRKIRLEILSSPDGAEVFHEPEGALVGKTPVDYEMVATTGLAVFRLRHPGFEDVRVQLPAEEAGRASVALHPLPARPTASRRHPSDLTPLFEDVR